MLKARGRFYEATVFSAGRARRILVDRELYHRPSGDTHLWAERFDAKQATRMVADP